MGHNSDLSLTDRIQKTNLDRRNFLKNLLRFAGAAAGTAYFANTAKALELPPEFYGEKTSGGSSIAGEKPAWIGRNLGLLAEASYHQEANVRGIFTPEDDKRGYSSISGEAQARYAILRLRFTDFEEPKGAESKSFEVGEAAFGLRFETKPFSGYLLVNHQKLPRFAGSDEEVYNREFEAGGALRLNQWFVDLALIHDPKGPDIYRQGNLAVLEAGLVDKAWTGAEVGYGLNATYLDKYFSGLTGLAQAGAYVAIKQQFGPFFVTGGIKYDAPQGVRPEWQKEPNKDRIYAALILGFGNDRMDPKQTRPRL